MYNTCIASSSRHTIDSPWDIPPAPPTSLVFPTSNLRATHCTQEDATQSCTPLLAILDPRPTYRISTRYSTRVPDKIEVQPGVWSDGHHSVLAANHPDVESFLAQARSSLSLPHAPSEVVFTLAALDVFYNPGDPAHWLFWSDERKVQTAEVVTRISLHQPPLIRSKVAWNGTPEYLSVLASHHGSTWRQVYENKPWYQILVPPKSNTLSRIPTLRKRKPTQVGLCDSLGLNDDDEDDIEPPPPKRSKPKRAQSPARQTSAKQSDEPRTTFATADVDKRDPSPAPQMNGVGSEVVSPQSLEGATHPNEPIRMTTRHQKRKAAQHSSAASEASASRSSSTSPAPVPDPSSSNQVHSRNRSTSQASAETLVGTGQRRSQSILSAATAVESPQPKKAAHIQGDGDGESVDGSSNGEQEASTRVTRGSARRARNLPKSEHDENTSVHADDITEDLEQSGVKKASREKGSARPTKGRQGKRTRL
ncbi:hypothetical protein AX16_010584 [Volvariella volvacea WC 439]|nr:hypothetical protein AX16_010584 [Volvariella volvacea WC 439]